MTETTTREARAMRALAMAGCQLAATEHGVTIVGPAREAMSQVAEDAVDALAGLGWTESSLDLAGTVLSSPGPLPDVVESRRAVQLLARSRYSDLRPVLDALWDLVVKHPRRGRPPSRPVRDACRVPRPPARPPQEEPPMSTDHYEKARSLLHTAAGFAAVTAGMDPRTSDFAAYRDSVTSSTAAGQAYATLALADEVRALRQALAATTEPSGARGGEPTSEGATPA